VPRQFSQAIGKWQENQILIPDWTYFLGRRHKKKRFFTPREASFATLKGMQSADQRGKPPAIRQPFGLRFFMKIGLISFTFGALLEFAMIKSGFYGTVLKTSSAPEFQQAWQEVGVEVHRQLREKRESGALPNSTNVERAIQHLEQLKKKETQDHNPSTSSPSA